MSMKTEVGIRLSVDARGVKPAIDGASQSLAQLKGQAEQAGTGAERLSQALGRVAHYALAGGGLYVLASAAQAVGKAVFDASASAQRLATQLNFATDGKSAQEMAFVAGVAQRLGLQLTSTAQDYAGFAAAARGTALEGAGARAVFEGIAKASAVMGLSADQSSGALLAVQQMMSKGVVSAEEFRGQLGERMPIALQAGARALGVTTAEFSKLLETGKIVAQDFLPKFSAAITEMLGDSVDQAAGRLDAAVNRMGNAWDRFKRSVGDSGVSQAIANEATGAGNYLTSLSDAMDRAKASGAGMAMQLSTALGQVIARAPFDVLSLSANALNGTLNAVSLGALKLNTNVNLLPAALDTSAQQALALARDLKTAEARLAELQARGAANTPNIYLKSAYADAYKYAQGLREAKRAQDALRDQAVGGGRGTINPPTVAQLNEADAKDNAALAAARRNLYGIKDDYEARLKGLSDLYASGKMPLEEYRAAVAKLAQENHKVAQSVGAHAKAKTESGDAFAAERAAAAEWTKTLKQASEGIEDAEGKTLGLNQAQQALVGYLQSPAYAANSEAMRQMALERLYAWDAALKHKDATEAEAKAVAAWSQARAKDAADLDERVQAQRQDIAAMGLGADAVAALTAAKYEQAAAEEEAYAAALKSASLYAGDYKDAYEQAAQDARARAAQLRELGGLARAKGEKKAALEAGQEWQKTADGIERSLTDALMRGFEGGKGFAKNLRDTLKNMFNTLVLRPVISAVMAPVAGALSGFANAATGGGGGSSGGGSIVDTLQSAYTTMTKGVSGSIEAGFSKFATSSAGQSLGLSTGGAPGWSVTGSAPPELTSFGQNMGQAMGVIGDALAGYAMGSMARSLLSGGYSVGGSGLKTLQDVGMVIGSALGGPVVGAVIGAVSGLVNRAFGRKLKDSGIEGTFGGAAGFEGNSYEFYKGGWFRSDKTKRGELDAELKSYLANTYKALQVQTGTFAATLGLNADKVATFTSDIKLSLKGLDDTAAQEALNEAISGANEQLAQQILGTWEQVTADAADVVRFRLGGAIEDDSGGQTSMAYVPSEFAKEGEKASDTLKRLATSLSAANQWFDTLGTALMDASIAGGAAASKFIELFGSMDAFTASMGTYYTNFYSEQERVAKATAQLSAELAKSGVAMPTSKEAYRALVTQQLAAGAGGAELAAKLLQLSGAFAQTADFAAQQAEAQADARKAATDAAWAAMQKSIDATREAAQAEMALRQERIDSARAVVDTAREQARELRGLVDDTVVMTAAQAGAYIDSALAAARSTGYLPDAGGLQLAIADARAGMDTSAFASRLDYEAAQLILANKLDALGDVGQAQLTTDELLLQQARAEVDRLDLLVKTGQAALDEARAGTVAVQGVQSAIKAFYDRLFEEKKGDAGGADKPAGGGGGAFAIGGSGSGSSSGGSGGSSYDRTADIKAQIDLQLKLGAERGLGFDDASVLKQINSTLYGQGISNADIAKAYGVPESDIARLFAGVGVPRFDVGTNLVPRTGLAVVHQGEAIVPKAFNPWASGQGGMQGGMQGGNGAELARLLQELIAQGYDIGRRQVELLQGMESLARKQDAIGVKQREAVA